MSQQQARSPFKQAQIDLFDYLNNSVFAVHLENPNRLPTSEIFCFSDAYIAKHHLRGSVRAAIHTGLNNPQTYINVSEKLNKIYFLFFHCKRKKNKYIYNLYEWI